MAGILGTWRNGYSTLMMFLLAVGVIAFMNHADFAEPAKEVRLDLTRQIMEDKNYDSQTRTEILDAMRKIPTVKIIPPQSTKKNQDTQYYQAAQKILVKRCGEKQGNAATLEFQTLFNQMRLPAVLRRMMPGTLLALMCLLALMIMLSTDDSRILASARTLAQDVVLPFIKKTLTMKQHLWLIRWLTLFVCGVFFLASVYLSQLDYINLYITIATSIWIGGAGAVTMGGLYTRFGTTAGAYASVFTGSFISCGGILLQRNWPDHVYPFLQSMGWVEGLDKFLRAAASPFEPYIRWEMDPVKFPINSMEISFIAIIFSVSAYCLFSFLTCRKPYDLDKLLHRGKYNIENKNEEKLKWTWKTFLVKIIGITPEYSRGDRIIAWSVFIYSFIYAFLLMFAGVAIWNWISPWPVKWWGYYYFISMLAVGSIIGAVSTVWFTWGGVRDMFRMFHDLALRKANPEDNGVVNEKDHENRKM